MPQVTIPAGKTAADVLKAAGDKIIALAKDASILEKLLKAALPESLWGLIAELAAAMAKSTIVDSPGENIYTPSASPSPAPGSKSPAPGSKSPAPGPTPSPGAYYGGSVKRRGGRIRRF